MTISVTARRDVERWLAARGVPQLIEGYLDERRMDLRATPLIGAWLVAATIAWWATRPDWPPGANVLSVALSLAYMAVAYAAVRRLRGRPVLSLPETWDLGDIALFGFLPGVPAALVHGPVAGALAVGNCLLGVGAIYVVVGFGLPEIAWSAIRRIGRELEQIVVLIARTLPLLLILVVFVLFAAEMWEAASAMQTSDLTLVVALLMLVAIPLVAIVFRGELRRIEARDDWSHLVDEVRDTPAHAFRDSVRRDAAIPRLTGLQRLNLGLLILVSQLVQSIFVAVVLAAFLVALALIVVPLSVQESWAGGAVRIITSFDFAGGTRTLSTELLVIAAMLGGIVGLYFTGLALSDTSYRAQYFARLIAEIEQIAAVHAVYVTAIRDQTSATPA